MADHEVVAFAAPYSFGASVLEYEGIPVLGAVRDSAGNDVILQNHEYFGADLTLTLADPFGLVKAAPALSQVNVAAIFPVDCSPVSEGDVTFLRDSQALPIAISRFGYKALRDEGADPLFAPHCVDTSVFCPGDPAPYRDTVPSIGPDTFVIGMVAMNRDPQRKGFAEQLHAFAKFRSRHPDTVLAIHSTPVGSPGINLAGMAARLGISGAIAWPDLYSLEMGMITDEMMASFYRGLDLFSFCSYGEGFGIPLIEAQACSVPVVTTNGSATAELCGAGWVVRGTPFWANGLGAWWTRPDVEDIYQAYELAFLAREEGKLPKEQAREFALHYDADQVFDQFWVPALEDIAERIGV